MPDTTWCSPMSWFRRPHLFDCRTLTHKQNFCYLPWFCLCCLMGERVPSVESLLNRLILESGRLIDMTEAFFCKKWTLGIYYTNTIYSTSKRVRFRLAAITSSKFRDQLCNSFGLLNVWQMTTIWYFLHSWVWSQFIEQPLQTCSMKDVTKVVIRKAKL